MLQLNSYRNKRYVKWLDKNLTQTLKQLSWQIFSIRHAAAVLFILFALSLIAYKFFTIGLLLFACSYAMVFFLRPRTAEKKPLVFTPRAIRLYSMGLLLLLCLYGTTIVLSLPATSHSLFKALLVLIITTICSPLLMLVSNTLLLPLEKAITRWYFNDAKKRLQPATHLKIIGITGSYGKTTTKYVLTEILRQKYNVLMPPGSYNTPMGITKIVRTQLKPTHEVFVAEMSAKQQGDIAELCDLAQPQFGILTAIGPQHLETFGGIEIIKQTKNELIDCLPAEGTAFFNMDDQYCQELAKLTKKKSIYYGINAENLNYRAYDIQVTGDGSIFSVKKNNDPAVVFTTKLLGQHNIYNILAAIAAASEFGMDLSAMVHPIKQLRPVEHRLELRKNADNVTFIDDAFNSNPVGSKMALEVLAKINGAKKIIVTPGMIELGAKEYELNKQFGSYIADVCDYVILVGKNQTQAIMDGLKEKNFAANAIFVARDFNEARAHLQTLAKSGDVVLFENDLPVDG